MIVKPREFPLLIRKLEALLRRTPPDHPKRPLMEEARAKNLAGFKGEVSTDYQLSFLPDDDYYIFQDLRLLFNKHYFQIDILLASQNFIILLEVKNIAGTLLFDDDFKQLIRTKEGLEEAFPYPLLQTRRHQIILKKWLSSHGFLDIPFLSFVVISNPSTIIRTSPNTKDLHETVIHRDNLYNQIMEAEAKFPEKIFTRADLNKLKRKLIKGHTRLEHPVLDEYQIKTDEIISGVFCPSCDYHPMIRTYGSWHCEGCGHKSRDAHVASLKDYQLLIDSKITNREAKHFLRLPSSALTTRLLSTMNFSYTGTNKDRVYTLVFNE